MTQSGSAGGDGVVGKRRARFNRWRRTRPFAGGALLILASLVIAWIPIHIAPETILLGRALSPVGLLFAALVFLCGMFALTRPELADIFGIFGIVFSIFSLYGALGGFLVGTALGIIGGVLCYAWIDEDDEDGGSGGSDRTNSEESGFEFDESEESDGLFGTRSVRSAAGRAEPTGAGGRTASVALLVVTVVVLGAFAHPFVAAAAKPYPDQTRLDGTIVIAEQFSGQSYHHQNVTTDTSNRESAPAARLSFASADIQGLTIYKNFRTGAQTPFHIKISGSSSAAPSGISLTVSEFYASQVSLAGVVPIAKNKWSTCPGEDFLLSNGDIGNPPITGQDVTTNTHRLYAPTVTIQNLTLTVEKGTKSTSVTGVPECTRNPVEPVLDLFTASALELLVEEGRLDPNATTNGTITNLTAPEEVRQNETFDVRATVTNTGYVNDTKTVAFRFDDERRRQNVTLAPDETTTVTFADIGTNDTPPGTYNYSVSAGNDSATGTIRITAPANATNTTATNATSAEQNTTSTNGTTVNGTTTNETTTPAGNATNANAAGGTETASSPGTNTVTSPSTPTETNATSGDTEPTTATPTETPTQNTSTSSTSTAEADGTETTPTETTPAETTPTPTDTSTANATTTTTSNTSVESTLVALP